MKKLARYCVHYKLKTWPYPGTFTCYAYSAEEAKEIFLREEPFFAERLESCKITFCEEVRA